MAQQQELMREMHSAVEEIVRAFARRIIDPLIAAAKVDFPSEPLADWLDHVRDHLLANLGQLQEESDRIIAKIRELIREGALRVALEGRRIGQINGLPVIELVDVRFGWPSRITASVGVGKEGVVNIEREVEMSGHIHDKGIPALLGLDGARSMIDADWLRTKNAGNHLP